MLRPKVRGERGRIRTPKRGLAVVLITHKVETPGNQTTWSEAAAKARVRVVDSRINDSNINPLSIGAYLENKLLVC